MKDQPIKLQLNSEAAIRSLIEGDPQLQLEIKNKISCAIAHGYEKINTETINNSVESLTYVVSKTVLEQLTVHKKEGWNYKTYLNPELQQLLDKHIDESIKHVVFQNVNSAEERLRSMIKERIDFMAERVERQIMDEAFENSVEAEVNRRLSAIQKVIDEEVNKNG